MKTKRIYSVLTVVADVPEKLGAEWENSVHEAFLRKLGDWEMDTDEMLAYCGDVCETFPKTKIKTVDFRFVFEEQF